MLGAVDERLAAQAPIVMVSHSMQGGCLCENAPGLRVDYSNIEIAAAPAPRPQIIVAATGDWTKKTMEMEGPAIEKIYSLFEAADRFHYTIFDYPHNYNKATREAVYLWFGKWLLHEADESKLKEQSYKKEADADLRVFPEGKYPEHALNEEGMIKHLVQLAKTQVEKLKPGDAASLAKWKETMRKGFDHALQVHDLSPASKPEVTQTENTTEQIHSFKLVGGGLVEPLPCTLVNPAEVKRALVAILVDPKGKAAEQSVRKSLTDAGIPVFTADFFLTGGRENSDLSAKRDHTKNFFTTYNRTDLQERVREIAVLCNFARTKFPGKKIALIGHGKAGLWTIATAAHSDLLVADTSEFDLNDEAAHLDRNIFFPGALRLGGLDGLLLLAAPNPIFLQNTGAKTTFPMVQALYEQLPNKPLFSRKAEHASTKEIVDWLSSSAGSP